MKSSAFASVEIKSAHTPAARQISPRKRFHPRTWIYSAKADLTEKSTSFEVLFSGGAGGTRTLDLCVANAPLSQLSYNPICNILYYITVKSVCQEFLKILSAIINYIGKHVAFGVFLLTFLLESGILNMYRSLKRRS